jgi:nucleoside-diphosphate-sugar epimerase
MKTALVLGAGGFIGSHMVKRLKSEGYWVRAIDLKKPEYSDSPADEFWIADLSDFLVVKKSIRIKKYKHRNFDEIYQFAADMGGAGYIFTGNNDASIMQTSASINLNLLKAVNKLNKKIGKNNTKIFYSSSACVYPKNNQTDQLDPNCIESSAYPANPDSEYGWEKLFSERLFLAYSKNYNIPVRIARYHNIYGPEGTYYGGKEKVPAAICRKVALAKKEDVIEVWGSGEQTRSFLYIDECINATRMLMDSEFLGPVNIGSEEMVSINKLVSIVAKISGKTIKTKHVEGPIGVNARNSNNDLIRMHVGWDNKTSLNSGLLKTYSWILNQVKNET